MINSINLKRILKNIVPNRYNSTENILSFYKLVIDLERSKEPDISEFYNYPINFKDKHLILLDMPCNKQFVKVFEENKNTRFPKDIYIGLIIVIEGIPYHLLNMIIGFNDIKDINIKTQLLPVPISLFEVNLKEADRLGLLPEKIETINKGINNNTTWQGLHNLLKKEISENITIPNILNLACSTKSMELSQIYSELNNQRLSESLKSNKLLYDILNQNAINNVVDNINIDEILQITNLDKSQQEAITLALNSKVSVITGPPGTGKTQVIQNILANALFKGKKVLVASKNNKAVDNIKDRFDVIDNSGYFLRFGSKKLVTNTTLPEIERTLNEMTTLKDNTTYFNEITNIYSNVVNEISRAKEKLEFIHSLATDLANYPQKIIQHKDKISQLQPRHELTISNIEQSHSDILDIKNISEDILGKYFSEMKIQKNIICAKFYGSFGFFYKLFLKKKYAMLLLNKIEEFPYHLKKHLTSMNLKTEVSEFRSSEDMVAYCDKILETINKVLSLNQKIKNEDKLFKLNITSADKELVRLETDFSNKSQKYNILKQSENDFEQTIINNKEWILNNSKNILYSYIQHNKLADQAKNNIQNYIDYIPNNIPWKDNGYNTFIKDTNKFLNIFKLSSVTSLSAKNAFPLSTELFDMLIIDEASQCDIASAIPLILRAKQLVVIGDPMQLKHITSVKPKEEIEIKKHLELCDKPHVKYAEQSLWDYSQAFIRKSTNGMKNAHILLGHYRCHPDIIAYSNKQFYKNITSQGLKVLTDVTKLKANPQGIVLIDIKGQQTSDHININEAEVQKSIEIAIQNAQLYPDASIGIVTPFRNQAERIHSIIPNQYKEQINVNTIHKYQGDEKDIMIYTLVITDNSPKSKIYWIDNITPNLVNVAVTRAKSTLYVVCNVDYIKAHSHEHKPLGSLVR